MRYWLTCALAAVRLIILLMRKWLIKGWIGLELALVLCYVIYEIWSSLLWSIIIFIVGQTLICSRICRKLTLVLCNIVYYIRTCLFRVIVGQTLIWSVILSYIVFHEEGFILELLNVRQPLHHHCRFVCVEFSRLITISHICKIEHCLIEHHALIRLHKSCGIFAHPFSVIICSPVFVSPVPRVVWMEWIVWMIRVIRIFTMHNCFVAWFISFWQMWQHDLPWPYLWEIGIIKMIVWCRLGWVVSIWIWEVKRVPWFIIWMSIVFRAGWIRILIVGFDLSLRLAYLLWLWCWLYFLLCYILHRLFYNFFLISLFHLLFFFSLFN